MAKGTFTITLADGTQLKDLELNGNNFISKTQITEETFKGKLEHVIISTDAKIDKKMLERQIIGGHERMELVQIAHYTQAEHGLADGWYFILRDISADELEKMKARADIDYLAMMTGVEL